jgi:hypothetical protein
MQVTIGPARGDLSLVPQGRIYRLVLHGLRSPDRVRLAVDGVAQAVDFTYDADLERLSLDPVAVEPGQSLALAVEVDAGTLLSRRDRRRETCQKMLRAFALDSDVKRQIDRDLPRLLEDPSALMFYAADLREAQFGALQAVMGRNR